MTLKLLMIEFDDPCRAEGWVPNKEFPKTRDLRCVCVGFEIERTKSHITIAQSVSKHDTLNQEKLNPFTIARENIKKIRIVVPKSNKKQ